MQFDPPGFHLSVQRRKASVPAVQTVWLGLCAHTGGAGRDGAGLGPQAASEWRCASENPQTADWNSTHVLAAGPSARSFWPCFTMEQRVCSSWAPGVGWDQRSRLDQRLCQRVRAIYCGRETLRPCLASLASFKTGLHLPGPSQSLLSQTLRPGFPATYKGSDVPCNSFNLLIYFRSCLSGEKGSAT